MRTPRFHVDDLSPEQVSIGGTEATHGIRVLRLKVGDTVELFDGSGTTAQARVDAVNPSLFDVTILSRSEASDSRVHLILAIAPPKGARADWMIEKCTELGVAELWLMQTERSVVEPGRGKIERWERIVSEASKQSSRQRLMHIEPLRSLDEILVSTKRTNGSPFVLYGSPDEGARNLGGLLLQHADQNIAIVMLIGPEGGFTENEHQLIVAAGGKPVRFSENVLRIETAAVATAAIIGEWALGFEMR